jgi:multiple sugar transport system permease protein
MVGETMSNRTKQRLIRLGVLHIPLVIFMAFTLFPFYWALNTSFKFEKDIISCRSAISPTFTLENYDLSGAAWGSAITF